MQVVCLQRCLVLTRLVPLETAAISVRSVYTIQLCITSRHFMKWHIRRVHACSAVTSHLPFRQNDWDFLRATAVTWGFRGDQNRYLARRQKCLQTSNTAAFFLHVIIQSGKQQTYFTGVLKTRSKARTDENTLQNRRQDGEKLKEGRQIEDSTEKDGKKEKLNWKGERGA